MNKKIKLLLLSAIIANALAACNSGSSNGTLAGSASPAKSDSLGQLDERIFNLNPSRDTVEYQLAVIQQLGAIDIIAPEIQRDIGFAIANGQFGSNSQVLSELEKNLAAKLTDLEAQKYIIQAMDEGKLGNQHPMPAASL